jgi:CheY-like chemotaxis protein
VSSTNKDNYYRRNDIYSRNNDSNDSNQSNKKYNSKIMVLDDDFDIATIIKLSLQKQGFNDVVVFAEASLALKEFRENHNNYSLVISDIRMPGINGFEVANYINEIEPRTKVILMTAFDVNDDNLLIENMKSGNNNKKNNNNSNIIQIIQKPVSPKKLAKMVYSLY